MIGENLWEEWPVTHLDLSAIVCHETSARPDMRRFRSMYSEVCPDATIRVWKDYIYMHYWIPIPITLSFNRTFSRDEL